MSKVSEFITYRIPVSLRISINQQNLQLKERIGVRTHWRIMNILDNNGLTKEPSGNLWSGRTRVNIQPLGGLQQDWILVVDLGELNI